MADEIKNLSPEEEIELSEAELAEFFADTEKVTFEVSRTLSSGKEVTKTFIVIVEPNNVEGSDLARYRKVVAEIAVRTDEIRTRAKAEEDRAEGDADSDHTSGVEVDLTAQVLDATAEYARAEAELLSKLVVSCDYPGKDFSDPGVLIQRKGAGPAARAALHDYFFGSSSEPEEETGETETPNTGSVSASSEATGNSEGSPATS